MGLFGKLKNILFEDDDEVEEMPVYTKEEVNEVPRRAEVEEVAPVVEEPIKTSDNSHFRNLKRDNELTFDEKDVLGEIPGAMENIPVTREENNIKLPIVKQQEEKKSIFPSFDEDEFERLNARINRNENRVRKEIKTNVSQPLVNEARRANNNFSSTSTTKDTRIDSTERYKINNNSNGVKKSFTPSPIISPVYGILDKNYTKDDIVDKKGGLKREKVVKPVVRKVEQPKVEEPKVEVPPVVEVDIDSVRRKAYGELEDLEKTLTKLEIPELREKKVDKVEEVVATKASKVIAEEVREVTTTKIDNAPSIEDQLEQKFDVKDIEIDEEDDTTLDEVVEKVIESKIEKKPEVVNTPTKKPQMLDDLEKTSTLQILDDIEKELNSIKPIAKDIKIENEEEVVSSKDDTLEKDLFNLIDSMYEEGEEE